MSDHNPGSELDLDSIEARRVAACDDENGLTWHERQDAIWSLLDDGGDVLALVAEVRRLRAIESGVAALVSEWAALGRTDVAWHWSSLADRLRVELGSP